MRGPPYLADFRCARRGSRSRRRRRRRRWRGLDGRRGWSTGSAVALRRAGGVLQRRDFGGCWDTGRCFRGRSRGSQGVDDRAIRSKTAGSEAIRGDRAVTGRSRRGRRGRSRRSGRGVEDERGGDVGPRAPARSWSSALVLDVLDVGRAGRSRALGTGAALVDGVAGCGARWRARRRRWSRSRLMGAAGFGGRGAGRRRGRG